MLIYLCLIFASVSSYGSYAEISDNGISYATCLETETRCGEGCCPHANATCCEYSETCCRQGAVCLDLFDICLGGQSDDGNRRALDYSEEVTKLRRVIDCPRGTTTCSGGCCHLERAVCCPDKMTCCPNGYSCDFDRCTRSAKVSIILLNSILPKSPSYAIYEPNLRKNLVPPRSGGPCCQTAFGFKCCPDFWICTYGGCQPQFQK